MSKTAHQPQGGIPLSLAATNLYKTKTARQPQKGICKTALYAVKKVPERRLRHL